MPGFSRPAAAKNVEHALGGHGARDDLAHGEVQILFVLRLAHVVFDQCRPHRLEERHVVADAERIFVRHGQDEGLGEIAHGL